MGKLFGVEHSGGNPVSLGENNGGGDHRPRHAAAPGFSDAGDKRKPLGPLYSFAGEESIPHRQKFFRRRTFDGGIFLCHVRRTEDQALNFFSLTLAALPTLSLR